MIRDAIMAAAATLLESIARGVCPCGRRLVEAEQCGRCYYCSCGRRFQGRKPRA